MRVRGSPSHLGPPKARISGLVWARRAPLMLMMRACGAHHEVTAAGGSSIIEFAGAAPRRPKTCPNATRNAPARAFRSHSPANFEFPRPCRQPRRGAHHEHQRDPRDAAKEGRRLVRASLKGFAFTASPSTAAEGARCAARFKSLRLKPPTPQELEGRTSRFADMSAHARRIFDSKANVESMDAAGLAGHKSVLS